MNDTAPNSPEKYDLPKAYEFAEVEQRWYTHWLEQQTFSAKMEEGKPSFSIVIPPPPPEPVSPRTTPVASICSTSWKGSTRC